MQYDFASGNWHADEGAEVCPMVGAALQVLFLLVRLSALNVLMLFFPALLVELEVCSLGQRKNAPLCRSRTDTNGAQKAKTPLHVSVEAVGIAKKGTRREASAHAHFPCKVSPFETSYFSKSMRLIS